MEHSKLPWRVNGPQIECDGHPRLVTKCENIFMEDAEIHSNSHFIVKACNEHDMLKAKAELFDEMVKILEGYETALTADSGIPCTVKIGGHDGAFRHSMLMITMNKSTGLLAKVKELK